MPKVSFFLFYCFKRKVMNKNSNQNIGKAIIVRALVLFTGKTPVLRIPNNVEENCVSS